MNNAEILILAGAAGVLLGVVFFGGLWWTVRRGVASQRAPLWFLVSLLIRTGIGLAGFYFVSGGQWDRLLACLLGFTIARFIVTRLSRPPVERGNSTAKAAGHAP
jgi:F1F0 ATPase subunit 2